MWAADVTGATAEALLGLRDPERARAMQSYMKDVAPFLGIPAAARRQAQTRVWRGLPDPRTAADVRRASRLLRRRPEREFSYAAAELTGRWQNLLEAGDVAGEVRAALTHVPWWDTVDLLGSQAVTPLVRRFPETVAVMWEWNASPDQWLVRASIQHQRGLGHLTDIGLLLALCEPHIRDRRFWVSKAVGWALRDTCRIDPVAVRDFVAAHPDLSNVAHREAERGLKRVALSPGD